jgi:uncharacterized iron-regulated protein
MCGRGGKMLVRGRARPQSRPMHRFFALIALAVLPAAASASPLGEISADIVVLGEVHDNPAHHAVQAEAVAALAPRAIVFEMLTGTQAARVSDDKLDDPAGLAEILEWSASGWPDFGMYYPIFAAARGAVVYGAMVPREETRNAMRIGIPRAFGAEAEAYGLTDELDAEELAERLNLQMAAHCNALPLELLPGMVDLQRLRDAGLARAALDALAETGGPVAVITGNGHARKDWGMPAYVALVAPEVSLFSLGQSEDGAAPPGGFDLVLDAPGVDRPDPCLAFR